MSVERCPRGFRCAGAETRDRWRRSSWRRTRWEAQSAGCPAALQRWAAEKKTLHPQAVIVELGYRDQFDWKVNGKVVHVGQPAFNAYVEK